MAIAHYADQMRFDDEARNSDDRYAQGFIDDDYVAGLKRAISGAASTDELAQTVGWIIRKFEANGHANAEQGSPEWREAARALAVAELEVLRRTAERDEGDFTGTPTHPLLSELTPAAAPSDALSGRILGPDSTKVLGEIAPDYIKERRASPQTNYEIGVTVRMFEQHLGEERPLYRITRQDVHAFKRALSETPANYTKRFPGMTLPEAIRANERRNQPYPVLDPRTINDKYLSKLHALLGWCVRADIIPDNPASSIKVEVVKNKGRPSRLNFSPSDLAKIFAPSRFDATKPLSEDQWAMVISLFAGTRASELAQVKLDSIRRERGILVLGIEEETKTAGSQRIIPVHGALLDLGLEKRVKSLRDERETHLFPDWYRNGIEAKERAASRGKATLNLYFPRFIPRRFNVTYLPKVGITDPAKTWHSFRHSFKTGLARAGVSRDLQDDLCGHDDNSTGAVYRHDVSVEAMKKAIEKLEFDGLDLAALRRPARERDRGR